MISELHATDKTDPFSHGLFFPSSNRGIQDSINRHINQAVALLNLNKFVNLTGVKT